MAKTLHLIKRVDNSYPWDLIGPRAAADTYSIVLIQDAVGAKPPMTCPTFVIERDAKTRGVTTSYPLIDETRLVELIWGADSVVVW
ncbi:MAG: hypothetical protein ACOYXU_13710 [Nitrospirota bacterium]